MDGTMADPCGDVMPNSVIHTAYTGEDNVLRFSIEGVGFLAVPDPGIGTWHSVMMIKP